MVSILRSKIPIRGATAKASVLHSSETELTHMIKLNTKPTTEHLTPELRLNLITPSCPLWKAPYTEVPFSDPFWAFYWPGGQVISRYILDNPKTVYGKRVLDFGCGSGACGIAAAKAGASKVILNDVDPVACLAANLNAEENRVSASTEICSDDYLSASEDGGLPGWDLVLVGDMFYDESFASVMYNWLTSSLSRRRGRCSALIGDPGRHALSSAIKSKLSKVADYSLPENCCLENRGFSSAVVWKLDV